jgi:hypothetical protein
MLRRALSQTCEMIKQMGISLMFHVEIKLLHVLTDSLSSFGVLTDR